MAGKSPARCVVGLLGGILLGALAGAAVLGQYPSPLFTVLGLVAGGAGGGMSAYATADPCEAVGWRDLFPFIPPKTVPEENKYW